VSSFAGIFFELGLGIAIGMIAGTTGLQGSARGRMALLAAAIGLVVGFLLAGSADLTAPVGAVVCLAGAVFAFLVVSDIVHGAGRREGGGSGALGFIVALAALVVVAIAVLVPLVVILILALLVWLALARRRRAQRKHAGLRVLR
jgi:phosphatidylserine synthase